MRLRSRRSNKRVGIQSSRISFTSLIHWWRMRKVRCGFWSQFCHHYLTYCLLLQQTAQILRRRLLYPQCPHHWQRRIPPRSRPMLATRRGSIGIREHQTIRTPRSISISFWSRCGGNPHCRLRGTSKGTCNADDLWGNVLWGFMPHLNSFTAFSVNSVASLGPLTSRSRSS